jgi:RNA polymerase sigma factor (sigma-70 family)
MQQHPATEKAIILQCKKGHSKYQEKLYKLFYGYAMGVSLRYLSNRDDAMEVVNDSFIKVFTAIQTFDENHPFKPWLRRIIVNTAIDKRRKNLKHMGLADLDEAEALPIPADAVSQLNAKDILQLMSGLPEVQRMIFNLFEIDGYSHDEIGKSLGISESASRVYLSRAKDKLRKIWYQQPENSYGRTL